MPAIRRQGGPPLPYAGRVGRSCSRRRWASRWPARCPARGGHRIGGVPAGLRGCFMLPSRRLPCDDAPDGTGHPANSGGPRRCWREGEGKSAGRMSAASSDMKRGPGAPDVGLRLRLIRPTVKLNRGIPGGAGLRGRAGCRRGLPDGGGGAAGGMTVTVRWEVERGHARASGSGARGLYMSRRSGGGVAGALPMPCLQRAGGKKDARLQAGGAGSVQEPASIAGACRIACRAAVPDDASSQSGVCEAGLPAVGGMDSRSRWGGRMGRASGPRASFGPSGDRGCGLHPSPPAPRPAPTGCSAAGLA